MTYPTKLVMVFLVPIALAACSGGSVTGGGTSNSTFVGTYSGSTTITISASDGSQTINDSVSIFVNSDGLVQFGDAGSSIFASGPLKDDEVSIVRKAAALVDPDCSGTITLYGSFSPAENDGATFEGAWSSTETSCFGVSGTVGGPIAAKRVENDARASRVLETNNSALLRAFKQSSD